MVLIGDRSGSLPLTRVSLRCGLVAGPLFITTFLVEGGARTDYNSLRHPVSSLSLSPRGWVQVANFAVAGTLYGIAAAGLSRASDEVIGRRVGPSLITAAAAGMLGAAAFPTDPVSGYPPGTPDALTEHSTPGAAHDLAAIPTFLGLPAAALAYSWRFLRSGNPGWALFSAATAASMLTNLGLSSAGFAQSPKLVNLAGFFQRSCIITGFGWLTALSAHTLKVCRPTRGHTRRAH